MTCSQQHAALCTAVIFNDDCNDFPIEMKPLQNHRWQLKVLPTCTSRVAAPSHFTVKSLRTSRLHRTSSGSSTELNSSASRWSAPAAAQRNHTISSSSSSSKVRLHHILSLVCVRVCSTSSLTMGGFTARAVRVIATTFGLKVRFLSSQK